jgi:UDP-glucose 4-epimerase
MLQGKQPVIYGDGTQKRCFSFVQDCVEPLVAMGLEPGLDGEVFNVGPDEEFVTVIELARSIADLLGFALDPIFVPERPAEVRMATCSADKARRRLGYRTQSTLRAGLERMIEWIRNRRPRPFDYYLPVEIDSPLLPETWRARSI